MRNLRQYLVIIATLSGSLLLGSCFTPFSPPEHYPPEATFPGLSDIIDATAGGTSVDVLSVHGMCSHGREWVVEAGTQFSEFLDLSYREPARPSRVVQGIEIWLNELTDSSNRVILNNYALVWSPLTESLKQALCRDVSVPTGACGTVQYGAKRASFNSRFKSELMNDCFADALIYLGSMGDTIRGAMRAAIISVGQERSTRESPLVLITESLGSKIVTDAVLGSPDQARADTLDALRGTKIIFMAANQIPLIDLAHPGVVEPQSDIGHSGVDGLRRAIQRSAAAANQRVTTASEESIYLVAFSDPNDLLTYELLIPADRTTINVRVSNARSWFNMMENPSPAHKGYLENPDVWELINCGNRNSCD